MLSTSGLERLKARQLRVAARQRALESRHDRKADTRRKILVGAIVLAKVDQGEFGQLHASGVGTGESNAFGCIAQ
jgi:hypothetical protein